ncbi:MAG: hypothetical protein V4501_01910 [Pseudomonadota bacterium]
MRILALCLFMLSTATAWAAMPVCATQGICEVGTSCVCTIPSNSTQDRYYYLQIDGLLKEHVYQCKMSNSTGLTMLITTAKVPNGASLSCQGSCQHFPVSLLVDTRELVKPTDSMLVKIFIPGTDVPTDFKSSCNVVY